MFSPVRSRPPRLALALSRPRPRLLSTTAPARDLIGPSDPLSNLRPVIYTDSPSPSPSPPRRPPPPVLPHRVPPAHQSPRRTGGRVRRRARPRLPVAPAKAAARRVQPRLLGRRASPPSPALPIPLPAHPLTRRRNRATPDSTPRSPPPSPAPPPPLPSTSAPSTPSTAAGSTPRPPARKSTTASGAAAAWRRSSSRFASHGSGSLLGLQPHDLVTSFFFVSASLRSHSVQTVDDRHHFFSHP